MKGHLLSQRTLPRLKNFLPFYGYCLDRNFLRFKLHILHLRAYTGSFAKVGNQASYVGGNRPAHLVSQRAQSVAGLPWTCPGCGAYSQVDNTDEAGYYSLTRKQVSANASGDKTPLAASRDSEQRLLQSILKNARQDTLQDVAILSAYEDGM